MAYVFKLPQTVTEDIMRYAIGYPRDRLRAIAADVVRTEIREDRDSYWKIIVTWYGATWHKDSQYRLGNTNWFRGRFRLVWDRALPRRSYHGLPTGLEYVERDREVRMKLLQKQCEACEPAELQLQRTQF